MPILQRSLFAALLLAGAGAASGQVVNPLAGGTQAPQERSVGPVAAPREARGQLLPDPASGGVVFTDEEGWYRFTMADGGETSLDGTLRIFQFESGGQNAACFAVRTVDATFAPFSMEQIQAELDTLYTPFDASILANGVEIVHRESIVLDATGRASANPLKVLAWDTRDSDGNLATYTLAPLPAGQLLFACMVGSADHAREIVQRYLRLGEGGTIPAR
jgi:hypothetical protein